MKIKFLGAAGTVTGSSYVLTGESGQAILVDLGMFQGPDVEHLNFENYQFDCSRLVGAILTHAHLDHCGRLPILLPRGYMGQIWMTPTTADLTSLSLLDSAKIARFDKSKKGLYDRDQAERTIKRFVTAGYHQRFKVGGLDVNMYDAGHIMGSASLEIVGRKRVVFSGDLGNSPEELIMPTETIPSADVVVMESTYGDRLHPQEDPSVALAGEINAVEQSGGTLLIPTFSLDRTQEILHRIKHLKLEKKVRDETIVYLDSPMGQRATDIYRSYPNLSNAHIRSELESSDPYDFPGLEVVDKRIDHEVQGAKVIVAGSGMMVGGRIVMHAARYLPLPDTRLFIVGYQGEGTLGRKLLEGDKQVEINGATIEVKASVNSTQAMSAHADQNQLVEWLTVIKGVKKVVLTHGDDGPRAVLAKRIREELGIVDVVMPHMNEEIDL